jgi:hypothetical protein
MLRRSYCFTQGSFDHGQFDSDLQARLGLDRPKLEMSEGFGSSIRVIAYRPNELCLQVDVRTPSALVYRDVYDPSWRVFVDGRRARLQLADDLYKKVALPRGEHEVRFVYRPRLFLHGFYALVAGCLLAAPRVLRGLIGLD